MKIREKRRTTRCDHDVLNNHGRPCGSVGEARKKTFCLRGKLARRLARDAGH